MEDQNKLATQGSDPSPAPEMVTVSKEKLKSMIAHTREVKEDNAQLIGMLGSAVNVLQFMKDILFGGSMPEKMDFKTVGKLALKLPRIIEKLDKGTVEQLKANFEIIRTSAAKFLDEEQINKIAK